LQPPALVFGRPGKAWHLSPEGVLAGPEGQQYGLLSARVVAWLVHVRVCPVAGGRSRSLLFHALNTPEPGFRRLRARLRWAPLSLLGQPRPERGNLPANSVSQPLTHGASGEDHGGLGLANSHDR
jgi:hypothetical protein